MSSLATCDWNSNEAQKQQRGSRESFAKNRVVTTAPTAVLVVDGNLQSAARISSAAAVWVVVVGYPSPISRGPHACM